MSVNDYERKLTHTARRGGTTALKGLPGLCKKCTKLHRLTIHDKCRFCQDMGFKEEILCHLNRNVQSSKDFECHAYAPRLKSAPSLVPNLEALSDGEKHDGLPDGFESLLNSDRFKYQVTHAVQRLEQNPDAVFVNLKYHLAWNVTARRPVFVDSGNTFDALNKAFLTGSEFVGGFAGLLWLATDHIHIYVESDGDKSIEAVVQEMKRLSAKALHKATEDQSSQFNTDRQIWDKAYFSETVG